jgi:hypothetical protein
MSEANGEISRRTLLKGMLGVGALALVSDERQIRVEPRQPYPRNPEAPVIENRPVRIFVDPQEAALSGNTFVLSSSEIPAPSPVLTDSMRQRGFQSRLNPTQSLEEFMEVAHVPEHQQQPIQEAIAPLDELRAGQRPFEAVFFPLEGHRLEQGTTINGNPDTANNRVWMYLKPDAPVDIKQAQMVAFNERLHAINDSFTLSDPYKSAYDELVADAQKLETTYFQNLQKKGLSRQELERQSNEVNVHGNTPGLKALGPLANIVAESSYLPQAPATTGGPLISEQELWASTLTIARYCPNSLRATIDSLPDARDQELMRRVVRASIDQLRSYADTTQKADALFSPSVLTL